MLISRCCHHYVFVEHDYYICRFCEIPCETIDSSKVKSCLSKRKRDLHNEPRNEDRITEVTNKT